MTACPPFPFLPSPLLLPHSFFPISLSLPLDAFVLLTTSSFLAECKRRNVKCDRAHPCRPCQRKGEEDRCQWRVVEPVYVSSAPSPSLFLLRSSVFIRCGFPSFFRPFIYFTVCLSCRLELKANSWNLHAIVGNLPSPWSCLLGPPPTDSSLRLPPPHLYTSPPPLPTFDPPHVMSSKLHGTSAARNMSLASNGKTCARGAGHWRRGARGWRCCSLMSMTRLVQASEEGEV